MHRSFNTIDLDTPNQSRWHLCVLQSQNLSASCCVSVSVVFFISLRLRLVKIHTRTGTCVNVVLLTYLLLNFILLFCLQEKIDTTLAMIQNADPTGERCPDPQDLVAFESTEYLSDI